MEDPTSRTFGKVSIMLKNPGRFIYIQSTSKEYSEQIKKRPNVLISKQFNEKKVLCWLKSFYFPIHDIYFKVKELEPEKGSINNPNFVNDSR